MTGSQYAKAFQDSFEALGFVEVRRVLEKKLTKVRLLMRIVDEARWLPVVERLHRLEGAGQFHICKTYFLKGPTKTTSQLVYGWNLTVTTSDMRASLTKVVAIVESLRKGSPSKVNDNSPKGGLDVDEAVASFELNLDAPDNRGVFDGAKGAKPVK